METKRREFVKLLLYGMGCSSIVKAELLARFFCFKKGYHNENTRYINHKSEHVKRIIETIDLIRERDGFADLINLTAEMRLNNQLDDIGIEGLLKMCDDCKLYETFD
jgi:hypothetical protein